LRHHEIGGFEKRKMLGHRLARHIVPLTKLVQCLPVPRMEAVEQLPPHLIGKGLEHRVHAHELQ
jgi:hypothetical protein